MTGFLLMISGVAIAIFMRRKKWWLKLHRTAGSLAVICFLCGFASAILMVALSTGEHFKVYHAYLGLVTMALILPTPFLGYLQFRTVHRWSGRVTLVFACMAVVSGLQLVGVF